jgi:hypothetical protein
MAGELAELLKLQLAEQQTPAAQPEQTDLFWQSVIGLAPILAGAAFGGSQGGAIGAQAGMSGLQQLEAGRKEREARAEKLAASARQGRQDVVRTAIELAKEGRQEKREQKGLELREREVVAKETESGKGSKMTSEQTKIMADFTSADRQMSEIENRIDENADIMGPVVGRVAGAAGYGTKAKAFDARMKIAAQDIGKALEGGKLAEGDVPRYRAMLPNLQDTPEVAREKAALIRELIANKRAAAVQAFEAGGYNVSKIAPAASRPAMPEKKQVRAVLPSGLGPRDAVASEKPGYMGPAVMQNGVMYKWNEAKGQYE